MASASSSEGRPSALPSSRSLTLASAKQAHGASTVATIGTDNGGAIDSEEAEAMGAATSDRLERDPDGTIGAGGPGTKLGESLLALLG